MVFYAFRSINSHFNLMFGTSYQSSSSTHHPYFILLLSFLLMALPSSSFSYEFKYDVFLSFRGPDTRYGFTGHLWKALCEMGIHTFIDDKELQRGGEITPSLVEAIKESRIGIIVLSKNYASSSFCLDELVNIVEHIKEKDRLVLPIFYYVEPCHVRHQTGSYGKALAEHEAKFKDNKEKLKDSIEKLQKWKIALNKVANLSGMHFELRSGYEHKFIEKIVKEVSNKINRAPLHVADYPVGMESQIQQVNMLLDVGSDDGVHMVGIYGIGGVGKTTLARAIYNSIADNFEGLCFLHNVRETSAKHGLVHLQENLLSKTVGLIFKLGDVNEGIPIIKQRLSRKKVLLILDDVDKLKQLQALVGAPDWFSPSSRIIITTRDKRLLARHGVTRTYEVCGLHMKESLELFRWNAFKNNKVDPCYDYVVSRAITYASGLPLALEVIGSHLFGKSIEAWKSALDRYERIPHTEIQEILKVSFDALEEDEQSIFLDIVCCFKGYTLAMIEDILHAHYDYCTRDQIEVLVNKSLIKIIGGMVTCHDLIEDMGKEIVRLESPKEPGKRSRLWFPKDIAHVLEDDTGTSKIEIIHLDAPSFEEIEWDGEAFKKMKNLKTIIIRNGHFSKGPKHLPSSLRVLEWQRYPSKYLPSDFHPKRLVILKLPNNCNESFELAGSLTKKFMNLKVLNFDYCQGLKVTPDVSGLSNLEEFSFQGCRNLTRIHDSVGFLDKLKILRAKACRMLRSFPPIKLTSLENLELSFCESLENFPEILEKMENMKVLSLVGTSIEELPFSIRNLTRLQKLHVDYRGTLKLPSSILMLPKLAMINLWKCEGCLLTEQNKGEGELNSVVSSKVEYVHLLGCNLSDQFLPICLTWFANVKDLDLSWNYFTTIPECIKNCCFLLKLKLDGCYKLEDIRGIPPNLKHFSARYCGSLNSISRSMLLNQEIHEAGDTDFCLQGARIPLWFEHRRSGPSISFWFQNKLPAITLCFVIQRLSKNSSYLRWDSFEVDVIINGRHSFPLNNLMPMNHMKLFYLRTIGFYLGQGEFENKWNHVEIKVTASRGVRDPFLVESGIHVFKEEFISEDIRFTDPYCKRKSYDDLNSSKSESLSLLNEGEEKLKSVVFPSAEHIDLSSCSLTDEYLPLVLTQYANVKELNLKFNNFTNVPECIKECHFLWKLILDYCKQLEEIRGIPPNLKHCSTMACNSLTSSCRNMLLNQLLLEVGTTFFCLPKTRIPQLYEHQSRGPSISFWFRNKFPAISLCLVTQERPKSFPGYVRVILIINGLMHAGERYRAIRDHAYFVDLQKEIFENNMDIALLENNWNHAEVKFKVVDGMSIESGIHVFSEKCIMKDIRFTDPYGKRKLYDDLNSSMSQNHQLWKRHRSLDIDVSETQFAPYQQRMALLSLQQQMALLPQHRRKALLSGMWNLLLDRKEEYLNFFQLEDD